RGAMQGIKSSIDNWLYPNDKIYEKFIRKELESFAQTKWTISAESCRYRGTLFESFHRAVFEHVFKNKGLPKVNSASSEADIISWKSSEAVRWCFENLGSIIEEEDKIYHQMVAKKVFGRQSTKNQYSVTQAILHNFARDNGTLPAYLHVSQEVCQRCYKGLMQSSVAMTEHAKSTSNIQQLALDPEANTLDPE
ncbi:17470_t:CDS:2, partial [Gigaspora margarita]